MSSDPSQPPITPEQLLMKLILTNTQILDSLAAVLKQQIIYTNALLFPNNNVQPAVTAPSVQTSNNNNNSNEQETSTKPSSTEYPSN